MDDAVPKVITARDEPIAMIKTRAMGHSRQSSDSEVFARNRREQNRDAHAEDKSVASGLGRSSIQERILSKRRDKFRAASVKIKNSVNAAVNSQRTKVENRLLEQIIPTGQTNHEVHEAIPNVQSTRDLHMPMKPAFGLPLMSNNFRKFNARIGVVFVFQNDVIHLLSWTYPTQTLSAACIFTFLVLHPVLIPMVPSLVTLFYILIPAYLSRHPAPPSPALPSLTSSVSGPPSAPPRTIAPANEFSSDFLRNMRDLQNTMGDFADGHDFLVSTIAPATNFSDEARSSALFCALVFSCGLLSIGAAILPWRALILSVGWFVFAAGHPTVQALIARHQDQFFLPPVEKLQDGVRAWTAADIVLDEPPESAEVEIFELQHRVGGSSSYTTFSVYSPTSPSGSKGSVGSLTMPSGTVASPTSPGGSGVIEYEPWLFSPSCWEPRAPARVSGDRVKGTRFFEDVAAPEGWEWKQKKWVLDLQSTEWVSARMLSDVEVESEGERWVYDVEEGPEGRTKRGEWRRRRWIRVVQRKVYRKERSGSNSGGDSKSKSKK